MKIGVIGHKGFLGKELIKVLSAIPANYDDKFDVIIDANGNSKKYLANKYPYYDFKKSVNSVYYNVLNLKYKEYYYISSFDVFKDNVYGFNKQLAENIVKYYCKNYNILRCSAIIGLEMKKGILYDYINNIPLSVSKESILQFITNTEIANIIKFMIFNKIINKIFTVGGFPPVKIGEVLKNAKYKDISVCQYYDYPIDYLKSFYYDIKSSEYYVLETLRKVNGI